MGRGLSSQQNRILGLAYGFNRFVNGGELKLRDVMTLKIKRLLVCECDGMPDLPFHTTLAAFVYGAVPLADVPSIQVRSQTGQVLRSQPAYGPYMNNPVTKAAKAAASRSLTLLNRRGLIA